MLKYNKNIFKTKCVKVILIFIAFKKLVFIKENIFLKSFNFKASLFYFLFKGLLLLNYILIY